MSRNRYVSISQERRYISMNEITIDQQFAYHWGEIKRLEYQLKLSRMEARIKLFHDLLDILINSGHSITTSDIHAITECVNKITNGAIFDVENIFVNHPKEEESPNDE